MAKIRPIQTNFSLGEMSPRLFARTDFEGYRSGLKECHNMLPLRHGPITSRPGMVYVGTIGGDYARPFPFQLTPNNDTGEAFAAVVSDDGTLKVYGATGVVAGEEELDNPDFNSGLQGWDKVLSGGTASVTAVSGTCIISPEEIINSSIRSGISQTVAIEAGTENEDRTLSVTSNVGDTAGDNVRRAIYVLVGTTPGGSDLSSSEVFVSSFDVQFNPGGVSTVYISILAAYTVLYDPPITYNDTRIFSTALSSNVSGVVEFIHPWTQNDIAVMQAEMVPGEEQMFFVTPDKEPYYLGYDPDTNIWEFDQVAFTSMPTDWVAGNYPATLTFFQGRSWWAGNPLNPETVYSSKSNEYTNLTAGVEDSDAITFIINRSGVIRWMEGQTNLVIGSTSGEHIVSSSTGIITPSDIQVDLQSAQGGAQVQSLPIGSDVFFISADGRKVWATTYYRDNNRWKPQEISFTAEHITQGKRILQMSLEKNPESIVWAVLDDGTMAGFTYEPFSGVRGWHEHSTQGFIQGVCTVEKAGNSITYLTVARENNGSTQINVELLNSNQYQDAQISIQSEFPTTFFTASHLALQTVSVKTDGAMNEDVTLNALGEGETANEATLFSVGLPYTQRAVTLPAAYGYVDGTAQGVMKRWNEISLRIIDSHLPLINGQRPRTRTPQAFMNEIQPVSSDDVSINNLGHDTIGSIQIEQNLPLALTISGLFGELKQDSL